MKHNQLNTVWMFDSTQHVDNHPDVHLKKKPDLDFCPFIWSWDIIIYGSGNVTATLYQHEKTPENSSCKLNFFYSREEIISALKELRCSTPFVQVALEGKLAKEIQSMEKAIEKYYSTKNNGHSAEGLIVYRMLEESNIPSYILNKSDIINGVCVESIVSAIAWKKTLEKVFRSSIAYDSPYGGGRNSIYNLLDFSGSITSSPSTP